MTHDVETSKNPGLRIFADEILKWNPKINLISKGSEKYIWPIHIMDGVLGSKIISQDLGSTFSGDVYDLGSGNGVPGIVFALLNPGLKVFSVESDERKCAFLKSIGIKLNLINYFVLNKRVENLELNGVNFFIARGFASVNESIGYVSGFSLKGSIFYHFKSLNWGSELGEKCSTWNIFELSRYELPTLPKQDRVIIKSQLLAMFFFGFLFRSVILALSI